MSNHPPLSPLLGSSPNAGFAGSPSSSSGSGPGGAQEFEAMFRRRLAALGHFDPEGFNSNDKAKFRQVVAWLEDQRVRHLDIEARDALRETGAEGDSDRWEEAWEGYLASLGCDREAYRGRKSQLMWLMGRAVQLQFAENADAIKEAREAKAAAAQHQPHSNGTSSSSSSGGRDPFEGVNIDSPEFRQSVSRLASKLKIPEQPSSSSSSSDVLSTLHAACLYLSRESRRRREDGGQGANNRGGDAGGKRKRKENVQRVNLDDHAMNIPAELQADKSLCQALKVMRLLQVQDLRVLQDEVNATIESVQKLTADPKTDTRLGKVGR